MATVGVKGHTSKGRERTERGKDGKEEGKERGTTG